MNVRSVQRQGIKPETLAKIILALLLLALLGLFYYYFVVLPRMGGGIVEDGNDMKVGKIQFLYAVYGPGVGTQPYFHRPMGVATDKFENMYVTDEDTNMVYKFSKEGRFLYYFGGVGVAWPDAGYQATWKPGTFNAPYGIDVDENGDVYVVDCLNQQIQVFNSNGRFIKAFPKPWDRPGKGGGGRGEGLMPTAIAVKNNIAYVADAYQVVEYSTKTGKFLFQFGKPGRKEEGIDRPNGIAVGSDGTIYLADSNHYRLQAFTPKGRLKWVTGKIPESALSVDTASNRDFGLPRGVAVDGNDNVYVVDAFHFSIQIFNKNGKKIGEVGDRGVEGGLFNFPNDIAITRSGMCYVADRANQRVQAIRIPGVIGIRTPLSGPQFPWWPLLMLLPLLAAIYLLARKPRYAAHSDFLAKVVENGDVALFIGAMKKVYVTPEVYNEYADYVQDERKMSNILKVAKQDTGAIQGYIDSWQISGDEAELLICGRRTLAQRLLFVRPIFLLEKVELRNKLEEAGLRTINHEEFVEQFKSNEAAEPTA